MAVMLIFKMAGIRNFKPVYVTSDIKGATEFMQLLYIHNFRINKENNIDNNKKQQRSYLISICMANI